MRFEWINQGALKVLDALLGWMLYLPRDLALLLLAMETALFIVLLRKFITNQELLRRCAADKRQLRSLIRAARTRRNRAEVTRHRATRTRVALRQFQAEWRPLLCSLLPLAAVGLWGWQRLEYHPPRGDELVQFEAVFPISLKTRVVHLLPTEGLEAGTGWIQELQGEPLSRPQRAVARWNLRFRAQAEPYRLQLRMGENTYFHEVRIGQRFYEPPAKWHEGRIARTEAKLRPVKLLGVVPGIPWLSVPGWMVGYLLLTLPAVAVLKRAFKVS